MMNGVKQQLRQRWKKWIERRIPAAQQVKLNQRTIFIVPSRIGGLFVLLLVLMLITAINYQNSLIYGLTFWLFSIAMSGMLFTFRNLSGLEISSAESVQLFAGEQVELPIKLTDPQRDHDSIHIQWPGFPEVIAAVERGKEQRLTIPFQIHQRGYLKTRRFKVHSRYPLGLYTSWSWVRLQFPGVVYPKPEFVPFIPAAGITDEQQEQETRVKGNDEFVGLRDYQKGDPIKHIAWKYLAKGKGLLTKEYDSQPQSTEWLDWSSLSGLDQETRLSRLCGWVLQAEKEGKRYGLKTPAIEIPPATGDQHREKCLRHLAFYGLEQQHVG
jgi:uncharacterized protein (DUF58 family)